MPTKDELEAYIPDVSEISTGSSSDDQEIATYIKQTTESLTITSKSLQKDKCDKFVSQVMTPISVYNEVLVHGTLSDWLKYIRQKRLPKQLESYRAVIENIMLAEWKDVSIYKKGI